MRPTASARSTSLALALALLAAACAERAGPTAPAGPRAPAAAAARAAARGGGAAVVRPAPFFGVIFGGDPRYGLAVNLWGEGEPPVVDAVCAGEVVPISDQRAQFVFGPTGKVHLGVVSREANVEVYAYGGGIVTDPCQLAGAPLVATGTVRASSHISDPAGSGRGAFVWHVTTTGVVDLASGGRARLFGTFRWVIRPDGTLVMDEEIVRLTPL